MTRKYSVHWNMAYEFIQTNTAAYNSNNGNSLLYKTYIYNACGIYEFKQASAEACESK